MRYLKETEKLNIDYCELVSIAHRGIAPPTGQSDSAPTIEKIRRSLLPSGEAEYFDEKLSYEFSDGKYSFVITGTAEINESRTLLIFRGVEGRRPSSEDRKAARGEGFILALMLASKYSLKNVNIYYHYLSSSSGELENHTERVTYDNLVRFLDRCIKAVSKYARPEIERVTERLPSMSAMPFPYEKIREGQSEFIRKAYRVLARGGKLYASAPTGTGKTVSAIFPALRALGDGRVDKVFYLTPKGTTALAVSDCVREMCGKGAKIKAVILSSKDSVCQNGRICKTSRKLCPNAPSLRLQDAVIALYDSGNVIITREEAIAVSSKYSVCPHELLLSYSELCDLVVCDINYIFDPTAYIRRFFDTGGRYAFLIDEAHNLSERIREAYSATLSEKDIAAPDKCELLGAFSRVKKTAATAAAVYRELLYSLVKEELREDKDGNLIGAAHTTSVPERLYSLFDELIEICEGELRESFSAKDNEAEARSSYLREYLHKLKEFSYVLSRFDSAYEMFVFYSDGTLTAKLYCLDTAPVIRERLSKGHSALLFSATLSPLDYYREVLGGDRSDEVLEVDSPFDSSQLSFSIMDKISTRYSEREDTLPAVCRAVAATVSAKRGNYMIFSPSFAYSEALADAFKAKYPKIKVLSQKKDMTASEKKKFLAEFKKESDSYLVAFCVMGGIYAEGIDLAGDSLIGAVIVGIGLPSLSYEREAIAAYYQDKYEEGKQYAYIYPGINRVFQAAGRVIRREDDRGVIVLIDDRFDDPIYKKSLPKLYSGVRFIGTAKELRDELDKFWKAEDNPKVPKNQNLKCK